MVVRIDQDAVDSWNEKLREQQTRRQFLDSLVDSVHTIKYKGTLSEVEQAVSEYEPKLQLLLGAARCTGLYEIKHRYKVKLYYENDKSSSASGSGDTYEEARQKAFEAFPFEVTDKVKEEVEVKITTEICEEYVGVVRKENENFVTIGPTFFNGIKNLVKKASPSASIEVLGYKK